jgi:energy-converting hydrogenase Eha subunit A
VTQRRAKPRRHPWRDASILAVLVLALGTFSGVEVYGRSVVGAFAVALVVLALIGLILASGRRR